MLGFIKKDFFLIKSSATYLIILIILFTIMAYYGEINLSFILPFISIVLMMTTFNFDHYSKWDAYAATLPNGHINSVQAKYLLTFLILLLATTLSTLLSVFFSLAHNSPIDLPAILVTSFGNFFASTLVATFFYPVIYKFSVEKAGVGVFIFFLSIAFIFGFATRHINFSSIIGTLSSLGNFLPLILLVISLILLFISYQISTKIYSKKEF